MHSFYNTNSRLGQEASKADQIRALNNGKRTTREIADAVGCLTAYVRVVLRQRGVGGYFTSDADRKYTAKPETKTRASAKFGARYASDENFRERHKAWSRRWYHERGGREWQQNHRREAAQ